MEFPDLGKHCSEETCKRLDFLPVKCDLCHKNFCGNHMSYEAHNCPLAYKKDQRVPLCPLCNNAVPVDRDTLPDVAINQHIENNCHIVKKKKVFTNKCSAKGCRVKELVPVLCRDCRKNYCFKHRHVSDHFCPGVGRKNGENQGDSAVRSGTFVSSVHGGMSEDEALARALQISLNECTSSAARIRNNRDNGFSQNCTLS